MTKNIKPTIVDFVREYCTKYSDKPFLREKVEGKWVETSYSDTLSEGRIFGAGLLALGLEKGEKVALISEGRNLWIFAELGILFAGGVNVPISFRLESDSDFAFKIDHSDSRYVIASECQIPKIRRILPYCPKVEKIIVLDNIHLEQREISVVSLKEIGLKYIESHPGRIDARMDSVQPNDYATISYTSGTTADPKGVILTHRNYTANVEQSRSLIEFEEDDVMLIFLPLDHCYAHFFGIYLMMSYGGSIATVPGGKNVITMLKNIPTAIKEVRPHVMLSVPSISRNFRKKIENSIHKKGKNYENLYKFALDNAIRYNREYHNMGRPFITQWWRGILKAVLDKLIFKNIRKDFGGRIKYFIGGGALLDIELQRYFGAIGMPIFQGYGLSEATPVICLNSIGKGNARFGSSGRTVDPMDIKICDADGNALPYGETGEIVIRGENVMAGYWKNPESTAKTVIDGWLHTGDLGYLCQDNPRFLYVTGRIKSLLISSDGEKYSPEEFENSLTDGSKYIDASILYNNQSPYTVVLIVPERNALADAARKNGYNPTTDEGRRFMLDIIRKEVDAYRRGGQKQGVFPEKWLPAAIIVADEPFTEQNGMLNTTFKTVRRRVESYYADRIEYALTQEGKNLYNTKNLRSIFE